MQVSIRLLLMAVLVQAAAAGQTPEKVFVADGISVRSYNFDAFEPMLHRENDTVYVVNFWATWCAPCVRELPFYDQLQSAYAAKKVKVLLVSLDMVKQIEPTLIPFIEKRKLKANVVHLHEADADAWIPKVDAAWSGALPGTLIYKGQRREFFERSFTYAELENEVKSYL